MSFFNPLKKIKVDKNKFLNKLVIKNKNPETGTTKTNQYLNKKLN